MCTLTLVVFSANSYLKNVILKFLEQPSEREQLVTVVSQILQLTPSEAKRLKESLHSGDPVQSIGSALGFW